MMKSIRASLDYNPFQSLSVYQELLCAGSSGSSVVVASIGENSIQELFSISPKAQNGNFIITGILFYFMFDSLHLAVRLQT